MVQCLESPEEGARGMLRRAGAALPHPQPPASTVIFLPPKHGSLQGLLQKVTSPSEMRSLTGLFSAHQPWRTEPQSKSKLNGLQAPRTLQAPRYALSVKPWTRN